MKTDIRIW